MSLVLETGSGIATADSYVDADDLTTYASENGLTLPETDAAKEALLRRAFTEMNSMQWKGDRTYPSIQRGVFPRTGIIRDGYAINSTTIPAEIKDGQMSLAAEIYDDDQNPVEARVGAVKRQKVEGAVEVEYNEASTSLRSQVAVRQSRAHFTDFMLGSHYVAVLRA